ncbi:MAG: CocE/NonD family hydrolase, partial [Gaiellaceae bacterium]
MKAGNRGRLAAAVAAALMTLALAPPALAQAPSVVVENGVTQPVFDYGSAIRERVWIQSDFDSDLDGVNDEIAVDIMRPAESDAGLAVPVIIDASPYYSTLGRGNEAERKADTDGDGRLDRWPLFYDNYFVPRGYAVILLDMVGTASSTGCPRHGGLEDIGSGRVVIDWLNGRRAGRDAAGDPVTADWHNGKSGMVGKSYDGTLANGTASTGVAGLTTIVPISAISSWYE